MSKTEVLAVVGGKEITQKDLDAILQTVNPQQAGQFQTEEGRKRLLDEAVNQQLLYLDAVERRLDQQPEFAEQLDKVKSDMLKRYAINHLLEDVSVADQEVKEYYRANKDDFQNPVTIKASHILLKSAEEAAEVSAMIESGTAFEEVAQKRSSCEGVDLGYFGKGQMVQAFEDTAFAMAEGEVSKPVETEFGWHIIKVFDRKKEKGRTYDEVKSSLANFLLAQKRQNRFDATTKELAGKYGVSFR